MDNSDLDLLSHKERQLGALLGAAVGDALGVTHEFKRAEDIPAGRFQMLGGGPFGFAPGAPSDDTDLLYVSLRAYPRRNRFDPDLAVEGMLEWLTGGPPDVGTQTRLALTFWQKGTPPPKDEEAQGNGGLMRAAAHALACNSSASAAQFARADTLLTHPSSAAAEVSAFYASALWWTIRGTPPSEALTRAGDNANPCSPYDEVTPAMGGWCVHSLKQSLWALFEAKSYEEGIDAVIRSGGDTDTNATIAGALLGARFGLGGIPEDWLSGLQNWNRERLLDEGERLLSSLFGDSGISTLI
jgi:ADP-ribosyl-[dinitrogen reductase] hydrolase